jgi:hypothetical protein
MNYGKLLARLSKWHEYLGDPTAADAILTASCTMLTGSC